MCFIVHSHTSEVIPDDWEAECGLTGGSSAHSTIGWSETIHSYACVQFSLSLYINLTNRFGKYV